MTDDVVIKGKYDDWVTVEPFPGQLLIGRKAAEWATKPILRPAFGQTILTLPGQNGQQVGIVQFRNADGDEFELAPHEAARVKPMMSRPDAEQLIGLIEQHDLARRAERSNIAMPGRGARVQ
jgi:hypothetical protein